MTDLEDLLHARQANLPQHLALLRHPQLVDFAQDAHTFDDRSRAELPLSCRPDRLTIDNLGSRHGVEVDRQGKLVGVIFDALPTGRQPIDHATSHAVANE